MNKKQEKTKKKQSKAKKISDSTKIKNLNKKIDLMNEEIDSLKEKNLRTLADFENFKKRTNQNLADSHNRNIEKISRFFVIL